MSDTDTDPTTDTDPATTVDRPQGGLGRRRMLRNGGVALAAAAVVAACGDDDNSAGSTATTAGGASSTTAGGDSSTTPSTNGGSGGGGDVAIAQLAASLEVLAVNTYTAALDAAGSGALGEVPPAVAEFVTVARDQHQEHLDALNGIITGAGETEVTEPPADLDAAVAEQFGQVTDVVGAARLALMLEETAAATYLGAVPMLESADAITAAGSIICVDRQHAAVLRFVLGEYPIPDTFANTEMAYGG